MKVLFSKMFGSSARSMIFIFRSYGNRPSHDNSHSSGISQTPKRSFYSYSFSLWLLWSESQEDDLERKSSHFKRLVLWQDLCMCFNLEMKQDTVGRNVSSIANSHYNKFPLVNIYKNKQTINYTFITLFILPWVTLLI